MHSTLLIIIVCSLLASAAWANGPQTAPSDGVFNPAANLYGTHLATASDVQAHNTSIPDQPGEARQDRFSAAGQRPTEAFDLTFLLLLFLGTAGLISIRRYVNS